MNRNRFIQILAVIALAACLVGSGLMIDPINTRRRSLNIAPPPENDSMPPQIALTSAALGSFRGVLVCTLWYRANALKDAGKYYEANALAEAITTLQPRMVQVWAFMAWNMAYNISVETNTVQERWDWVNKGIMLLRDKGIQYNPRAVRLYRELSWIFFHKIGQFSDDAQWYYKAQLAREWQEILGAPSEGATEQQVVDAFAPIANAPDRLADAIQAHPEVQALVDRLRALGLDTDEATLRQIGRIAMYNYSPDVKLLGRKIDTVFQGMNKDLPALLEDPKLADAFPPLLAYMRKKVLAQHYHMDAQEMLYLLQNDGPLDWRSPAAHGHYWADMGTRLANEGLNPTDSDLINTYRQRLYSIQDLMRGGRLVFDPISGHIDMLPDPRFVDVYERVLKDAKDQVVRTHQNNSIGTNYDDGYQNFLLQATCFSYLYGGRDGEAKAAELYTKLRKIFGSDPTSPDYKKYTATLEETVASELMGGDMVDMISNARQTMDAMVVRGLRQGLYNGDRVVFSRFINEARIVYDAFQKKSVSNAVLDVQRRLGLPPFNDVIEDSYISVMKSNLYRGIDLARIWVNTPADIQMDTYGKLRDFFADRADHDHLNLKLAFPAPPGWKPPASVDSTPTTSPAEVERH